MEKIRKTLSFIFLSFFIHNLIFYLIINNIFILTTSLCLSRDQNQTFFGLMSTYLLKLCYMVIIFGNSLAAGFCTGFSRLYQPIFLVCALSLWGLDQDQRIHFKHSFSVLYLMLIMLQIYILHAMWSDIAFIKRLSLKMVRNWFFTHDFCIYTFNENIFIP